MNFFNKTDLDAVRKETKNYLMAIPYRHVDDIFLQHPFSACSLVTNPKNNNSPLLKIGSIKKDYELWQQSLCSLFDKLDFWRIYLMVNKPYRFDWIRRVQMFLSEKDFADVFGDAWVSVEFPSMSTDKQWLIDGFTAVNKRYLMDSEEYKVWESLPDNVEIYRGCVAGQEYGMSWTVNKQKAEWFANRFEDYFGESMVLKTTIPKEKCLAYFHVEEEVVVDTEDINVVQD